MIYFRSFLRNGTSSGSVAAFLTESIMIPNEVYECESCGIDEANQRRSFVLKAFPLTMKAFTESPDLKEDIQTIRSGKQVFDTIMALAGGIGLGGQRREGATANPSASGLLQSEDIQAVLTSATLSLIKNKSEELKNFITSEFYKIAGVGGEVMISKRFGRWLITPTTILFLPCTGACYLATLREKTAS